MKAIEEKMVAAVNGGYNFKSGNTEVCVNDGIITVKLFGNVIFYKTPVTTTYYTAGWHTVTTASRLRALGADISFKRRGLKREIIFN